MQQIFSPDPTAGDADWQKLAPVLDQAIGELAAPDRDAVVLRFFEARPFAEIGATLRLTEDAARMRVERVRPSCAAASRRRPPRWASRSRTKPPPPRRREWRRA